MGQTSSRAFLVFVVLADNNLVVVKHTTTDIVLVVARQVSQQELHKLVVDADSVLLLPLVNKVLGRPQPSPWRWSALVSPSLFFVNPE